MIPIKYNLRSLRARWVTSLMTIFGTALVVWATVLAFGLADGLDHTLAVSGDPLDLMVLRKGATAETASIVDESVTREIASLQGIDRGTEGESKGRTLSSPELVVVVPALRATDGGRTNLLIRGVTPVARSLRPELQIVTGREARPGLREAITSRSVSQRFTGAQLGEELQVMGSGLRIVGIFDANDSAAESEVWTDLDVLAEISKRTGVVSSIQMRATDAQAVEELKKAISAEDERFALHAMSERDYYADQAVAGAAIKTVGLIIFVFLLFGAVFAMANTMYGAVATRAREIGTLRALGFSRTSVVNGFLIESLSLALVGGLIGCLGTLPVNGLSTGTANWVTFSELTFSFRFGPRVLLQGAALAIAVGVVGGIFPAIRATRMKIVDALREI
jgi:putative ABC transport system permease protein